MELVSIKRPDWGTLGRPIALKANHFALTVPTTGHFFHYHIDMKMMGRPLVEGGGGDARDPLARQMSRMSTRDPSAEPLPLIVLPDKMVSKEVKRRVIEILQEQEGPKLFSGAIPAFDGESNLFTTTELSVENVSTKTLERTITIPKDAEYRQRTVRLLIQECKPKKIAWSSLNDAIQGRMDVLPFEVISCLNTVLREAAITGNKNIPSGRSYFSENENAFTLGRGRLAWVGFYASARPVQTQLSLNIDVSHCVFYEKGSLHEFMAKLLGLPPNKAALQSVTDQQRKQLMLDCKDLKVCTKHSNNDRTYTIKRLSKESAAFCKFDMKGEQVTVADYFQRQYNIKLQYPGLPLIETASKMYVPVELCHVLPGQKVKRKLTEEQTGTVVRACARPAPDRMRHIQDIREKGVDYDQSQHMQQFGIKVDRQLTVFQGRVLPLPIITQRANKTLTVRPDDGSWDGRASQFVKPMKLDCWALVVLDDKLDEGLIKEFMSTLLRFGRDRGMTIVQPYDVPLENPYPVILDLINKIGAEMYEKSKKELQMVLFILGNKTQYAEIKKAGDVKLGVPTQVVLGQTIFKNAQRGMPQLAGNLLLKMNAKLGGINNENTFLCPDDKTYPILNAITKQRTIIFGADVTHPGFGEDLGKPSVAAVVASTNGTYTEYAAEVRAQYKKVQETTSLKRKSRTQEIITDLRNMVLDLLEKYYNANGKTLPNMIIFYRDGVSEGQYKEVMKTEVEAIREACFEAYVDDPVPPITYIIVGKRHHIRLFATNPQDQAGRAKNVPPGTIADVKITHFSEFDYYLCSHGGIQGTSRPAHYHVLHDESRLSSDQIQLFSYYLTFLYSRCNRSVGIPTPVYYAHLAAFRARHHLHEAGFASDRASTVANSTHSGDSANLDIGSLNKAITVSTYMKGLYFA